MTDNSNAWRTEGRIKCYLPDRCFGFIFDDTDGSERYFHLDQCGDLDPADLRRGVRVSFLAFEADRGPRALDVCLVASVPQ